MKIALKDLLNTTMNIIRKYANDELVRKIVNGSRSDLVFTITIINNSINISTFFEDCLRVESHKIDDMNIYNSTSSTHCYVKDLVTIWISPDWKSVRFSDIEFSDKDIDHVFTDDDIKEILKKNPSIRSIITIESPEYMDENGIIDTDLILKN